MHPWPCGSASAHTVAAVLALAAAVGAAGCMSAAPSASPLSHASFVYEGCAASDCNVTSHRLASGGAQAIIDVALRPGDRLASAASSDPDIATFAVVASSGGLPAVRVVTGATPGSVELQLYDPAGRLIDMVTVATTATAHLGYDAVSTLGGAVTVLAGSTQTFRVTTQDADGETTLGSGSVQFALDGPLARAATVSATSAGSAGDAGGDSLAFDALGAGTGSIHASVADGVAVTLPVVVVSASDVADVTASIGPNSGDGSTVYANVAIVARTTDAPIYGVTCAWSVDPPVDVETQSASQLAAPAQSTTRFRLPSPGDYTARCAVGATNTSLVLRR